MSSQLIVLAFISLDGVMQAPGGPKEDISGNFKYGGWTVPYFDAEAGKEMGKQMSQPADLLLGRKTYDIFATYWPTHEAEWPGVNSLTKYVVSNTLKDPSWQNTVVLSGDVVAKIKNLKNTSTKNLQVHGSATLIQTLWQNDLVDELWLKIFPVTLGGGKRLFGDGTIPKAFTLLESKTTGSGVIFLSYKRSGAVKTGSF